MTDIRCANGCGTVVATTDKDPYPGDGYYGMLCETCAKPAEVTSDE